MAERREQGGMLRRGCRESRCFERPGRSDETPFRRCIGVRPGGLLGKGRKGGPVLLGADSKNRDGNHARKLTVHVNFTFLLLFICHYVTKGIYLSAC